MQTENSQTDGKRIMPETRFIQCLELSVDPRVGIFLCASETDDWLFFLPVIENIVVYMTIFLLFPTIVFIINVA